MFQLAQRLGPLGVLFVLIGCNPIEEEPLAKKPRQVVWEQEPDFTFSRSLVNTLHSTPTSLWVGHDVMISEYVSRGIIESYSIWLTHTNFVKTEFGSFSFARTNILSQESCGTGTFFVFYSLANPVTSRTQAFLELPLSSSPRYTLFAHGSTIGAFSDYSIVDSTEKFLTVATAGTGTNTNSHAFIIATLKRSIFLDGVQIIDTLTIPISGHFSSSCSSPNSIEFISGYFFVAFSDRKFRVSTEGEVVEIFQPLQGSPVWEFFGDNSGNVYAHRPYNDRIYRSADKGLNWVSIGTLSSDVLRFRKIRDYHVFFGLRKRDLYQLQLSNGKYKRLDLTGVGQYGIEDVALYNGRVYIATWGGGIYSKPIENLLDPIPGS